MFAVGMGPIGDSVFSLTTMLIAIPTGVKIFNWIFTMWDGQIRFTTAMKFAISLVGMFTIGGISGVMHSSPPADLQQTDTYFIVAHFHYVLFGGAVMGTFGGIYHYFPKMFGRLMNEKLGTWHFWMFFIGLNLTFFPMHFSGMLGMPRRIYTYDAGQGWELFNQISTAGVGFLGIGLVLFLHNFFWCRKRGPIAGPNPWDAATLEWSIPSPPPDYNFATLPNVTSRYPLWDMTHPEMTAGIPHTAAEERNLHVDLAGQGVGDVRVNPLTHSHTPAEATTRTAAIDNATETRTARELGIGMPASTINPLFAALSLVLMISGMLFMHRENKMPAITIILVFAAAMVFFLYNWLLSPLEED